MKKLKVLFGVILGLALTFSLTSTVFAEGSEKGKTGTTTREKIGEIEKGLRNTVKEQNDKLREEIKNNRASTNAQIKKIKEERKDEKRKKLEGELENHIGNISNRLTNSVENLTKIDTKIDARIVVLKQAGKDTTAAENLSTDAKASIQAAKDAIAKLPALKTDGFQAEKLSLGLADLKLAISGIEKNLKIAKDDLIKALQLIKGLGPIATPATGTSTTTPGTTTPATVQ